MSLGTFRYKMRLQILQEGIQHPFVCLWSVENTHIRLEWRKGDTRQEDSGLTSTRCAFVETRDQKTVKSLQHHCVSRRLDIVGPVRSYFGHARKLCLRHTYRKGCLFTAASKNCCKDEVRSEEPE